MGCFAVSQQKWHTTKRGFTAPSLWPLAAGELDASLLKHLWSFSTEPLA
jgi:hypothetical protein